MLSDFPILSDLFYRIKSMCGYDVTRTYLVINDRCRYNSGFWCRDNKGNSTGTDTFGLSCFPYSLTDSVLNTYCNLQVQNTIPTFEPTNQSIISKVSFISGVIDWKVSAILHELFYSVADGSLLNDYVLNPKKYNENKICINELPDVLKEHNQDNFIGSIQTVLKYSLYSALFLVSVYVGFNIWKMYK